MDGVACHWPGNAETVGGDYGSCDPSNQKTGDPSNIMSIVYDPSLQQAYMPAACNTYIHFNFTSLFDGFGPAV
eukprot:gene19182-25124_t